jgi:hypothetical protein
MSTTTSIASRNPASGKKYFDASYVVAKWLTQKRLQKRFRDIQALKLASQTKGYFTGKDLIYQTEYFQNRFDRKKLLFDHSVTTVIFDYFRNYEIFFLRGNRKVESIDVLGFKYRFSCYKKYD